MSVYSGESGVYVAIAKELTSTAGHGSGYDLYEYLHDTQGVGPGPTTWYGDPGNLTRYQYSEEFQDLLNFAQSHLGPSGPGPSPSPPPTPPPSPPTPAGHYMAADQSYTCPSGYVAVQTTAECQTAAGAIEGIQTTQVTAQSDPDDPQFCWAYGSNKQYTNVYMNSVGTTSGIRPLRSAICKKASGAELIV